MTDEEGQRKSNVKKNSIHLQLIPFCYNGAGENLHSRWVWDDEIFDEDENLQDALEEMSDVSEDKYTWMYSPLNLWIKIFYSFTWIGSLR